jgi:hypothetical protein
MTDTARTTRPMPKDVVLRLEAEIVPGIPLQDDVREGRGTLEGLTTTTFMSRLFSNAEFGFETNSRSAIR